MLFTKEHFDIFTTDTLEARMAQIRAQIQPVFQQIGDAAIPLFEKECHVPFYLHIAQHRRRTVYPPAETWAGIGPNKRGYKMDAHFQIGINADYVFVWLSVIDQPKNQQTIADAWLDAPDLFSALPADFVLSPDHTRYDVVSISEWPAALSRLKTIKKSECQIGKIFPKEQINEATLSDILAAYEALLPLYMQRHGTKEKESIES